MKTHLPVGAVLLLASLVNLSAAVVYVDLNSVNPTPPYLEWSTAATNIQDAVDASSPGDLVLVTNGVYQTGGRPASGEILTNRVLVTNAITLQSVNGPEVTVIRGYQVATNFNGDGAVRCVHLAEGSTLNGFTLVNGATRQIIGYTLTDEGHGGGAWCQSTNVTVSNCILLSNCASLYGGGVYSGTVRGCQFNFNGVCSFCVGGGGGVAYSLVLDSSIRSNYIYSGPPLASGGAMYCVVSNTVIEGNTQAGASGCSLYGCSILNNTSPYDGGGVVQSFLDHCTVSGNSTRQHGGGAFNCTLNNCVISSNRADSFGGGVYCSWLHTNVLGQNNLVSGNSVPYQGGGVYLERNYTGRLDSLVNWMVVSNAAGRDGGGLYLFSGAPLQVDGCTFAGNFSLGNGGGACPSSGSLVISNSTFAGNIAAGSGGGAYSVWLTNCTLIGNQATTGGGLYGVATNCVFTGNVASGAGGGLYCNSPYAVAPGCCFTNNSAANGGGAYNGNFTNCIFSANTALTNGGGAYNASLAGCLVISNQAAFGGGAFVSGSTYTYPGTTFTYFGCRIAGNAARTNGGGLYHASGGFGTNCLLESNTAGNGGGAYGGGLSGCTVQGNSARINGGGTCSNNLSLCTVANNLAGTNGGGTCGSTVYTSLFTGNSAPNGGGACGGSLYLCALSNNVAGSNGGGTYGSIVNTSLFTGNTAANGGGAYGGNLSLCALSNNIATTNGGGTYNAIVNTSLLTGNTAANGGGACASSVNNSTIVNNQATLAGGGVNFPNGASATSCIIYDNAAPSGPNHAGNATYSCSYCCTTPLPSRGNNNLADDPSFVSLTAGNYRLQTNSPCINVGSGTPYGFDLDGRPRKVGSAIDIGAYEFQGPGVGDFIPWLQQYGLPINGTADYADTDRDGANNWQEWIAGTEPTNSSSALKLLTPALATDGTGTVVSWQSVSDRTYFLQRSDDLTTPAAFSTIQSNIVGQCGTTSFTDTNALGKAACLYRVGIQ